MNKFLLIPILLLGFVLSACDSNDVDDEGTAMVQLRLQPMVNGSQMLADETKTYEINGATVTFTSARMYLSQIVLHAGDGDFAFEAEPVTVPAKDLNDNTITHTVTDRIVLVKHDTGEDTYLLGEVPAKRYTGISFMVGIEGTDNRVDPTQVPAGHPLARQTDRNNHWNWSAGYQYIRMDGLVDTDGDGTGDEVWETHLGTENMLAQVDVDTEFTLNTDDEIDLHIMADYGALLADVDLNDPEQRLCHTGDNLPVANKVKTEISGAFEFHGLHTSEGHNHE